MVGIRQHASELKSLDFDLEQKYGYPAASKQYLNPNLVHSIWRECVECQVVKRDRWGIAALEAKSLDHHKTNYIAKAFAKNIFIKQE